MFKLWGWIKTGAAILGAALVAIGISFLVGRKAGIEYLEAEQAERRLKSMQDRKGVDDEVNDLGSSDLDDSYRKWLRDNGR